MNDRDKMLRKARKTKQEIDWSTYKLCRNRVQAQIKKCKNQYYKNLLKDSLNMSPKTNPSFNVEGKTITDKNVIANVFCRYFSTVANSLKRKSIYLREFVWKKPGHHTIKSIKSFKFSNVSERDDHNLTTITVLINHLSCIHYHGFNIDVMTVRDYYW